MNLNEKELMDKVKPGTTCGKVVYTLAFFVLGLLFVFLGFWKTLFIIARALVGLFIGSSRDLRSSVSDVVNKVVPPKHQRVEYTEEELAKIRKLKKEETDSAEEEADQE